MSTDPIPRFCGATLWHTLTREKRDIIGAAALDLVCAWYAQENASNDVFARAADAAEVACIEALRIAVVAAVPRQRFESILGRPLIPETCGDICRYCGCTWSDACEGGCSWAAPGVCSSCAPAVASPGPETRRPT